MPRITGLIARSAWGARFADGFGLRPMPFSEIWAHHSVTVAPDLVFPWTDDDAAVRRLEDIGQSRFGGGISYTVPITPSGRAYEGHAINKRGAHTGGRNTIASAICFVGNYETQKLTPLQEEKAAQVLVRMHRQGFSTRHTFNGGHRDAPNQSTACPGKNVIARLPAINARANALWAAGYAKTNVVASAIPVIVKTVTRAVLVVDGDLGPATIRQWQKVMGTPVDGKISWPSMLIKAVQRRCGITADGKLGPNTWRAIQRRLGVRADGVPGPITIKALQRRLNTGKF